MHNDFEAYDESHQLNVGGNNYGPIYLSPVGGRARLRQLPATIPDFVGHSDVVTRILESVSNSGKTGPRLVNLFGPPGSGKSTLATHIGNSLSDSFVGDHIYIDLRQRSTQEDIADILIQILSQLGYPRSELPADLSILAPQFRSEIRDSSILILDNVPDSRFISSLLPGVSQSVVLLTSWEALVDLPLSMVEQVNRLDTTAARELLHLSAKRAIGGDDDESVSSVITFCDSLPLALRIAGGILRARPHWTWSTLSARLAKEGERLNTLVLGTLAVRSTIGFALQQLQSSERYALLAISLTPLREVDQDLATRLIACAISSMDAANILDRLIDVQLVEVMGNRYLVHELVRLSCRETIAQQDNEALWSQLKTELNGWLDMAINSSYRNQLIATESLLPNADGSQTWRIDAAFVGLNVSTQQSDERVVMPFREVFPEQHPRAVLSGVGGSGKSTVLKELAVRYAQTAAGIPFLLLARHLTVGELPAQLEDMLVRTVDSTYEVPIDRDYLSHRFARNQDILLIDGIDEIADRQKRSDFVDAIRSFSHRYPDMPILVTSRLDQTLLEQLPGFAKYDLEPFDTEQTTAYLARLADLSDGNHRQFDLPNLEDRVDVSLLTQGMRTPLAIAIVDRVVRYTGYTPKSWFETKDLAYIGLLNVRDIRRGIVRNSNFFDGEELTEFLELLAYQMQSNPQNRTTVPMQDVFTLSQNWPGLSYRALSRPGAALTGKVLDIPVLVRVSATMLAFSHTGIREHFAVKYMLRDPQALRERLAHDFDNPAWTPLLHDAVEQIDDHAEIALNFPNWPQIKHAIGLS